MPHNNNNNNPPSYLQTDPYMESVTGNLWYQTATQHTTEREEQCLRGQKTQIAVLVYFYPEIDYVKDMLLFIIFVLIFWK